MAVSVQKKIPDISFCIAISFDAQGNIQDIKSKDPPGPFAL